MKSTSYVSPTFHLITIECQSIIAVSAKTQERELLAQQRREEEIARKKAKMAALKEKYGEPTRIVEISWYKFFIFEEKELILLDNKEIPFSSIISCLMEKKVIRGKPRLIEEEEPITLDHVLNNRAPEKIQYVVKKPDSDNYYVVLTINDLNKPTYTFDLGNRLSDAMELKGLFDVIIARNSQ